MEPPEVAQTAPSQPLPQPVVPPTAAGGSNGSNDAPDEGELIRRSKGGDIEAFDLLVRKHQERVYATIYHMTANHEDAADLAQETFIKAYNALRGFKGDCGFFTWLYRIAVNRTLNFLKSRRHRTLHLSLNDLDFQAEHDPDVIAFVSEQTPRRQIDLTELQQKLNVAMLKLSEVHRMVVILHDIQGLPHDQIAAIMDCNAGTVRSRLHYARQQLQGLLGDYIKS